MDDIGATVESSSTPPPTDDQGTSGTRQAWRQDLALVEQYLADDFEASAIVVERTSKAIDLAVREQGLQASERDDVAQETLLALGRFRGEASLETFARRVAWRSANKIRKARYGQACVGGTDDIDRLAVEDSQAESARRAEKAHEVGEAVKELPGKKTSRRVPLLLRGGELRANREGDRNKHQQCRQGSS